MPEGNYVSGDDYVVEFLGYRFGFNTLDFEQRVNAAAVKLGLVEDEELDPGEIAWLDHRVKERLLEVEWDDTSSDFTYRDPRGDRTLLELAPVPSWHELQFRR